MFPRLQINYNAELSKTVSLKKSFYFIGRGSECLVKLQSPWISRIQSTIVIDIYSGRYVFTLYDGFPFQEASRNGTFVNRERIVLSRNLIYGDVITFGGEQFPNLVFYSSGIGTEETVRYTFAEDYDKEPGLAEVN